MWEVVVTGCQATGRERADVVSWVVVVQTEGEEDDGLMGWR